MKDIVGEALERSASIDVEETDIQPTDEFGPPRCAVVGCGPKGIHRLERFAADDSIDFGVTTIAVGRASTLESATIGSDDTIRIPITEEQTTSPVLDAESFEEQLRGRFNDLDIIVVTGHLDSIVSARSIKAVCEHGKNTKSNPMILAAPTIPSNGLCKDVTQVFFNIVHAAGTTVPYDYRWILHSYPQLTADEDSKRGINQTVDSRLTEWMYDIFELFNSPMTSPIDYATTQEILRDGDVGILYWGERSRTDGPDTLLDQAEDHRVCDGDRSAIDGWVGLIRFGETYTLKEFETLESQVVERFAPIKTEQPGYSTIGGKFNSKMGEKCRITLILTGIDPESLSFIDG